MNLLDSINPTSQTTLHIVMLGLDSAGKTTVLYRLKFDQYLNTVPTIGFNCEKIRGTGKAKGVQFLVWDVGGQEKLRPLWRSYTRCTDGIVFVLDSVDVERMEEAKIELMRTANSNQVGIVFISFGRHLSIKLCFVSIFHQFIPIIINLRILKRFSLSLSACCLSVLPPIIIQIMCV